MSHKSIPVSYQSYLFFDYESTGLSTTFDQATQFAYVKTDKDFNILENQSGELFCKPRPDVVPDPYAFLVTKQSIKMLAEKGLTERDFAAEVQRLILGDGAQATVGYNNINFDNELNRTLMYRNLQDPYQHEWAYGNGSLDIYKLVLLAHAYAPDSFIVPLKENGEKNFKLEALSKANGIEHEHSHDALSDVYATIGLAKLIKEREPKIFNYFQILSNKKNVRSLLMTGKPFFYTHVYSGGEKKTGLFLPLVQSQDNTNSMICFDLSCDAEVLKNNVTELKRLTFLKKDERKPDESNTGLVNIKYNKQPLVKRAFLDNPIDLQRCDDFGIDVDKALANIAFLNDNLEIKGKVENVFELLNPEKYDTYEGLYIDSFLSNDEKSFLSQYLNDQKLSTEVLFDAVDKTLSSNKMRLYQLLLRNKWNSFSGAYLSGQLPYRPNELVDYFNYIRDSLTGVRGGTSINEFEKNIKDIKLERALGEQELEILTELEDHVGKLKLHFRCLLALKNKLAI